MSPKDQESTYVRSRLSTIKTARHLLPFVRASAIQDVSVYWLPVSDFPIKFRQRAWILEFLDLLCEDLKKEKQTVETFLQLKYTRTALNEEFINHSLEYRPMTGLLLAPGKPLPENLTPLEAKRLAENPAPDGTINIDHLAPDYTAWFAGQQSRDQRRLFLGFGGMMLLWIDEGGEPGVPKIEIPNVIRTHPAMKGADFEAQIRRGLRLQHPFLARSREIFAAHLPDGPAKRHSLFVLPRFSSQDLVGSTPEMRKSWFEIFSAYCIESEVDKGILLALRNAHFDERLLALVEKTKEKVQEYPS